MNTTIFEWREDEEYGGEGWIPKGISHFNISDGMGVAHDCLEHFPGHKGTMTDEMLAFGAMLYIRGDSDWFCNNSMHGTVEGMGSDIGRFLRTENDLYLDDPGRTHCLPNYSDATIHAIIDKGLRTATSESRYSGDSKIFTHNETTKRMLGWMRKGYRRCIKRYNKANPHNVAYLFDQIKDEINQRYKHGELGDELHVRVDDARLKYHIERKYPYDDESFR